MESISLCFTQLFEEQAAHKPDAIAVQSGHMHITYQLLNERANRLACFLHRRGVGPEVRVGVSMRSSVNLIESMLGILKAGGVYLPLDPEYPPERLNVMVRDAGVAYLLSHEPLQDSWANQDIAGCCLEAEREVLSLCPSENVPICTHVVNTAYIIYTSGSTGKPKGVWISHGGLSNVLVQGLRIFGNSDTNRVVQFSSPSFDASIFEICYTFAGGMTLCLLSRRERLPGRALINMLDEQAVTTAILTPSVLDALPLSSLNALQTVVAAGEACSAEQVKHWSPGRRFFNAYGPTEATVWATIAQCTINESGNPPIGHPIGNVQTYILDQHLQRLFEGTEGELYLGGSGLAYGYVNHPDLTAERFIPHPFSNEPGARLYRTGDACCYRSDREIEYRGRLDTQVKLRGLRIELEEITSHLLQYPQVSAVVVLVQKAVSQESQLVAYVVPQDRHTLTPGILHHHLRKALPSYMVPSVFHFLDHIPLTFSGKMDVQALAELHENTIIQPQEKLLPSTPLEKELACIWGAILEIEQVGLHDNFFGLGGHSLLVVQLLEQINQRLGIELAANVLFEYPTIAQCAHYITGLAH